MRNLVVANVCLNVSTYGEEVMESECKSLHKLRLQATRPATGKLGATFNSRKSDGRNKHCRLY